jgi:class 3 adenylate cyclase
MRATNGKTGGRRARTEDLASLKLFRGSRRRDLRALERLATFVHVAPGRVLCRGPGVLGRVRGVAGLRPVGRDAAAPMTDRVLSSVLFTDIVASTERVAELGDKRWSELLDRHNSAIRRQLDRFGGTEVNTTGDGFIATFDGPARAVSCACAIRDVTRQLGLEVRSGVHTGEIEVCGDDIAGIGVHIAARVSAAAERSTVLVSRIVTDLVTGSGLRFIHRGTHDLKGVPGSWDLYAVADD